MSGRPLARRPTGLAAILCAMAVALLAAQQADPGTSQNVTLYVTVTDDDGRLVPDLLAEHFEVYDNGKRQAIVGFMDEAQPITVVLMLDHSGSMTLNLPFLRQAAEQFVTRLLPDDRALVGSFADEIFLSTRFMSNHDALIGFVRHLPVGNPTRLWDAADLSLNALVGETGRRVVLVFSDGDDTASRDASRGDVIERAQAEDVMIYGVGLRSQYRGPSGFVTTRPDRGLRRLAEETGGGYTELSDADDLAGAFTRVIDELRHQYALTFSPDARDGKLHDLELKVTMPDVDVRARRKYRAPAGGGSSSR